VKVEKPAPDVIFRISELDPQAKCGPGTSVQFLHRVIERRTMQSQAISCFSTSTDGMRPRQGVAPQSCSVKRHSAGRRATPTSPRS